MKTLNKFRRKIIFIMGLIGFIAFICINTSFSHSEINYKKITISNGDTLWGLAKYEKNNNAYFENKDIRDIIEIIKTTNNLKKCDINIGDELTIPVTYK